MAPAALQVAAVLALLPAMAAAMAMDEVRGMAFHEGLSPLFGEANMERSPDGRTVRLTLDSRTGSGFVSSAYYHHGFFSAAIKLPKVDHTAGVVVAFYLSNGDVFERNHDELDVEFLGNRAGHEWRLQTNVYGDGSTGRGREERYLMPFDPTAGGHGHRFSILWSPRAVVFSVDGTPIREVPRSAAMGLDYPSKPMALYATIWDGSTWATDNGKYRVDYARGPFTAELSGLVIRGCRAASPTSRPAKAARRCGAALAAEHAVMAPRVRTAMRRFRRRQMLYTVCYDTNRYQAALPECDVNAAERQMFWRWGESKAVRPAPAPPPPMQMHPLANLILDD